jgi:hypothetical protein
MSKSLSFWSARARWVGALFAAFFATSGCASNTAAQPATTPLAVPVAQGFAEAPAPEPVAEPVTTAELRAMLAERRATHLAQLAAYAAAGEFPRNTESDHALNVFVDADGHVCAAANLIVHDGLGDLVQHTARTDNYVILAEVTSGALYDWMLTSGFTQEEIGMIQRPYRRPDPEANAPAILETAAAPPAKSGEQLERERVQAQLTRIHEMLAASSGPAVELAAARLETRPDLLAALTR